MSQDYNELSKEELLELARERDIQGRSNLDKEGLVKAHEEFDASSEDAELEEFSDEEEAELEESLEGEDAEAFDQAGEVGEATQDAVDLSLAASGPFVLERPENRIVTGAVNEEQAAEQEAQRAKLGDDFVGDFPEFVTDEVAEAAQGPRTVNQEDVIDFPPNLVDHENAVYERSTGVLSDANEDLRNREDGRARNVVETQGDRKPLVAQKRTWNQRAQLYTDGLGGTGDHNLERAYLQADVRAGLHETVLDADYPPHKEALDAEKKRQEEQTQYDR